MASIRIPIDMRLAIAGALALVVVGLMLYIPKDAPLPQQGTLSTTVQGSQSVTLASVAQHASASDCWTAIDGKVYDITSYIGSHPGGRRAILEACGKDATVLFETQGGGGSHSNTAKNILAGFAVGTLGTAGQSPAPETPPAQPAPSLNPPAGTYTMAEVARHASATDCWIAVRGKAYDVTSYIPIHPGGRNRIINACGTDATVAFETQGGGGAHSQRAYDLLEGFALGPIEGAVIPTTPPPTGNGDDEEEDDD